MLRSQNTMTTTTHCCCLKASVVLAMLSVAWADTAVTDSENALRMTKSRREESVRSFKRRSDADNEKEVVCCVFLATR